MEFVIGQRWASQGEKNLGLGIVTQVDFRRVTIHFPAACETRTFASEAAPLSRIRYRENDSIQDMREARYTVLALREEAGVITYQCLDAGGNPYELHELELNCFVQFSTPAQRLTNGQFSRLESHALRLATLSHLQRLQQAAVNGLLGARTNLLAHQIYIANEVASRQDPRVLLADEVGLGKTIEAGLILHHRVQCAQASRILILVPESLLHQWLVEMLRRFNLRFSIFDRSRVAALLEAGDEHPFESEQQVLCSLEEVCAQPALGDGVLAAHWDMLVVDEAHHLHWSPRGSSREYDLVEQLARKTDSLLLLTATPEQLGLESHFARLRLLDPARFHNLDSFRDEQAGFQGLNNLVREIQDGGDPLSGECRKRLARLLGDDAAVGEDREAVIRALLDRHGTGRVLFRNTRSAVSGFPARRVHIQALPKPQLYDGIPVGPRGYFPEQSIAQNNWIRDDPRVDWLEALIKSQRPDKILVICHLAESAMALERYFNLRAGIRCTAFHEGQSLVERDRAAAWFADTDAGAQVMICSEIGSEGRNFQFAHHLVLFDLPLDPDLVEQRIGRLDRIGQQQTIEIHVPYIRNTAHEVLFRWFHEGLDIFAQSCPAGNAIQEQFKERLDQQLQGATTELAGLIEQTRLHHAATRRILEQGRDRLLELNSCNPLKARQLIEQIEHEEQSRQLDAYMRKVFDHYGVDYEEHSDQTLILRPSGHLRTDHFPGLPADGISVCSDRAKALVREDLEFLSWEHPMVSEVMEMILNSDTGNACIASMHLKTLKPASLLLETCFTIDCVAPAKLQLHRYLPLSPTRLLLDAGGNNYTDAIPQATLDRLCQPLAPKIAQALMAKIHKPVDAMLVQAQKKVAALLPEIQAGARRALHRKLSAELDRLRALGKVNPGIRETEIDCLKNTLEDCDALIGRSEFQLQAIRLMINR